MRVQQFTAAQLRYLRENGFTLDPDNEVAKVASGDGEIIVEIIRSPSNKLWISIVLPNSTTLHGIVTLAMDDDEEETGQAA